MPIRIDEQSPNRKMMNDLNRFFVDEVDDSPQESSEQLSQDAYISSSSVGANELFADDSGGRYTYSQEHYERQGQDIKVLFVIVLGMPFHGSDFRQEPFRNQPMFRPTRTMLCAEINRRVAWLPSNALTQEPDALTSPELVDWLKQNPIGNSQEIEFFRKEVAVLVESCVRNSCLAPPLEEGAGRETVSEVVEIEDDSTDRGMSSSVGVSSVGSFDCSVVEHGVLNHPMDVDFDFDFDGWLQEGT